MNQTLRDIAKECGIERIFDEAEEDWKARVVYSAVGRMALASLWDRSSSDEDEQNEPVEVSRVSQTHFKRRLRDLLCAWMSLLPEVKERFDRQKTSKDTSFEENASAEPETDDTQDWPEELKQTAQAMGERIYRILERTGQFYVLPKCLSAAMETSAWVGDVCLWRGAALNRSVWLGGLGAYTVGSEAAEDEEEENERPEGLEGLRLMFHLPEQTLEDFWQTLQEGGWEKERLSNAEYLRTGRPFYRDGYWQEKPLQDGTCLARTSNGGRFQYCFYRAGNQGGVWRSLQEWQTEKGQYWFVANACLAARGTLPPIRWRRLESLVRVELEYPLPPEIWNLLQLYSWPDFSQRDWNNFRLFIPAAVFQAIQPALRSLGYSLQEQVEP